MPRQTEPSVNNAMGALLEAMLPRSDVRSENILGPFMDTQGFRPDILITAPGRSPVVIEAEYMPAASVEAEAKDRLGLETEADGRIIEAAIALRYPDAVGEAQDLPAALSEARLSYCVFTENGGASRFPRVRLAGRHRRRPGRYDSPGLRSPARRRPGNYHSCRRASTAPPKSSTNWTRPAPALH